MFEGLKILEKIPYADLVEVRLNEKLDEISNKIDVVVYAEFSSDEALNAFKSRPLYEESIERMLPNCRRHTFLSDSYSTAIHTGQWSDGFSIARNV